MVKKYLLINLVVFSLYNLRIETNWCSSEIEKKQKIYKFYSSYKHMLNNIACIGEDPKYQSIKEDFRGRSPTELENILADLEQNVSKRNKNQFYLACTATGITLLGLTTALVTESLGMKDASKAIMDYTGIITLSEVLICLGYSFYLGSGKRRIEEYQTVAADTLLIEQR